MTITQIGVCLVSYQGDQGSWAQRLFRRDLRAGTGNALDDLLALLDNRNFRGSTDVDERGKLSELARRGIMAYAERAILTRKAQAPWRLGHGVPMPYELLTGSGSMELLDHSIQVMKELLLDHRKVIFVPSAPADRRWLTLGHALFPLEFVILETIEERMLTIVEKGHYSKEYKKKAEDFCKLVGPQIVLGIYRTSSAAPPCFFFGHQDYACEAALIAMADSVLQEHRGLVSTALSSHAPSSFSPHAKKRALAQGQALASFLPPLLSQKMFSRLPSRAALFCVSDLHLHCYHHDSNCSSTRSQRASSSRPPLSPRSSYLTPCTTTMRSIRPSAARSSFSAITPRFAILSPLHAHPPSLSLPPDTTADQLVSGGFLSVFLRLAFKLRAHSQAHHG